jgi:hypothetical protein
VSAATPDGAAVVAALSADEVAALEALRWMVEAVAGVGRSTIPLPGGGRPDVADSLRREATAARRALSNSAFGTAGSELHRLPAPLPGGRRER